MGRVVGYEPARIGALYERAQAVVAHLAAARCADPAAADAVRTSAAVLSTVDQRWLPALDRVLVERRPAGVAAGGPADDATRSLVRRPAPAAGRGARRRARRPGRRAVDRRARRAATRHRRVERRRRGDDLVRDGDRAGRARRPPRPPRARRPDDGRRRAGTGGAHRARHRGPDPADRLRRRARAGRGRAPPTPVADGDAAGVALGYLFNGPQLPTAFLVSATPALRDVEVEAAADRGRTPPPATAPSSGRRRGCRWPPARCSTSCDPIRMRPPSPRPTPPSTRPTPSSASSAGTVRPGGRCSRTGPPPPTSSPSAPSPRTTDGRSRPPQQRPRPPTGSSRRTHRPRCMPPLFVASAFVNDFGPAHGRQLLDDVDDETSTNVAAIIGRHLPSVHLTVVPGTGNGGAPEPVGVVTSMHEVLGPSGPRVRAQFDPDALRRDARRRRQRTGRRHRAPGRARRRSRPSWPRRAPHGSPAGRSRPTQPTTSSPRRCRTPARLEGVFAAHVGHRAEHHGRDRDEELSRWIHGLGAAVQFGLGATGGPVTSAVVGPAVEPVAVELTRRLSPPTRRPPRPPPNSAPRTPPTGWCTCGTASSSSATCWTPSCRTASSCTGSCRRSTNYRRASPTSTPTIPTPITPPTTCARSSTPSTSPRGRAGLGVDDAAVYDAIKAAQLTIYQDLD